MYILRRNEIIFVSNLLVEYQSIKFKIALTRKKKKNIEIRSGNRWLVSRNSNLDCHVSDD